MRQATQHFAHARMVASSAGAVGRRRSAVFHIASGRNGKKNRNQTASSLRGPDRPHRALWHTDLPSQARPAGHGRPRATRRVRTRRRRLRPALWRPAGEPAPAREPAPEPEAWARARARAPGPGPELEPALVSGRELGPARRCGAPGGGASARLIRAAALRPAALAGARRSARGGACGAARGAWLPGDAARWATRARTERSTGSCSWRRATAVEPKPRPAVPARSASMRPIEGVVRLPAMSLWIGPKRKTPV